MGRQRGAVKMSLLICYPDCYKCSRVITAELSGNGDSLRKEVRTVKLHMDTEDVVCGFCKRGSEAEKVCGPLHVQESKSGEIVSAHHKCMQYSALLTQYKFKHFGGFKINDVIKEIQRGKKLACYVCRKQKTPLGKTGATAGCAVRRCSRTFHFYCGSEDHKVITKRFVMNDKKKNKTAILYRVFCCQEHKEKYIADLEACKDDMLPDSDSDEDEDEDLDDWSDKDKEADLTNENDVSYHKLGTSSPKATSIPKPSRYEHSDDINKHTDSNLPDTDTNTQVPAVSGKRQNMCEMSGRPLKRLKKSSKAKQSESDGSSDVDKSFAVDRSKVDVKLMRKNLPVVRVTAVDSHLGRASPASSSVSEASSCSTSNGHSTPDIPPRLPSQLRNVNLTEKVTDIVADTVALCIVGNLEISADKQDELVSLIQKRYYISKHSIYLWHKVVKKHGLKSLYMIHFMSELTESLVNGEVQKMERLLICPQSQGVQEKFRNIQALQDKLGDGFRCKLDQGMYKMVYDNLKKVKKKKGCTVGELLPLDDDCVLVLLIHSSMEGTEELINVFSPTKALDRGDNSTRVFYPLWPDKMAKRIRQRSVSLSPLDAQEEMRKLTWWSVANISEPVQLKILPLEREILCSPDYLESSIALHMYQFMKKIYAFSNPEVLVVCVVSLDQNVVQPSEYLLRVLKRFLVNADSLRYAFVDVANVSVFNLLNELNEIASNCEKNLECFSTVNPEVRSVTTILLKASNKAFTNCSVSKHHQPNCLKQSGLSRSYPACHDSDEEPMTSLVRPEGGGSFVGVKFVEDGEMPSTSKEKRHHGRPRKNPR